MFEYFVYCCVEVVVVVEEFVVCVVGEYEEFVLFDVCFVDGGVVEVGGV